jgi:hypothetical protein
MIGFHTCFGMIAIFDSVPIKKELCGDFSLNLSALSLTPG